VSNEIIDSYEKVLENSKKTQLLGEEHLRGDIINGNKQDPFQKFLHRLSKIQIDKSPKQDVSNSSPGLADLHENVTVKLPSVEPVIIKKSTAKKEDPLKKFMEGLILTIKQEKEQQLIEEQAEQQRQLIEEEDKNVKEPEQNFEQAEQEETLAKEEPENPTNVYVQQLRDKIAAPQNEEDIKLKSLIDSRVVESINKYKLQHFPNFGFTGGGGGTNAVQYALGGTMNGDLNVTGKYLSGGIDLMTLFKRQDEFTTSFLTNAANNPGGPSSNQLTSGPYTLTLNEDGSVRFPNNTIAPNDEEILNLESGHDSLSGAFTRVALSPYGFFAYDGNSNSITFDSLSNDITLTVLDTHEWKFNSDGTLQGPNNNLVITGELSSTSIIYDGVGNSNNWNSAFALVQTLSAQLSAALERIFALENP
jgi:hypothetical protein